MYPYPQGPGFQQQWCNGAPQTFGPPMVMPMPMPGMPEMTYPSLTNTPGYPQVSQAYPQANAAPGWVQSHPQSLQPEQSQIGGPLAKHHPQTSGPNHRPPNRQTQEKSKTVPPVSAQKEPKITKGLKEPKEPKAKPTVVPVSPFDPRKDAEELHKAMKGFGTREKPIINILTKRTYEQRQKIADEFNSLFDKRLLEKLRRETSGNFENVLVALMTSLPNFYAKELHDAIAFIGGTKDETLIEILCSLSNKEIATIKNIYQSTYNKSLEEDIGHDTSGHYKELMLSLCKGTRSEDMKVNQGQAKEDAEKLYHAGEKRVGTDESVFIEILSTRSYPQLKAIFQEYHNLYNRDIDDVIQKEFSFNIEKALRAIVRFTRNRPLFFAKGLHSAMKGLGTKDRKLIRIMVTRSEIDLGDIADIFKSNYGGTLRSWIEDDCSGHYKKCLLGLLGSY